MPSEVFTLDSIHPYLSMSLQLHPQSGFQVPLGLTKIGTLSDRDPIGPAISEPPRIINFTTITSILNLHLNLNFMLDGPSCCEVPPTNELRTSFSLISSIFCKVLYFP